MSKKANGVIGRPRIDIDPAMVERLAARRMTKDAIADFLSIGRSTLMAKLKEYPELEEAWLRGRATLRANVMDWLISSASKGDVKAQIHLEELTRDEGSDGADAAEDSALHIRAALKRMVTIENGDNGRTIDQPPQQPADNRPIIVDVEVEDA